MLTTYFFSVLEASSNSISTGIWPPTATTQVWSMSMSNQEKAASIMVPAMICFVYQSSPCHGFLTRRVWEQWTSFPPSTQRPHRPNRRPWAETIGSSPVLQKKYIQRLTKRLALSPPKKKKTHVDQRYVGYLRIIGQSNGFEPCIYISGVGSYRVLKIAKPLRGQDT